MENAKVYRKEKYIIHLYDVRHVDHRYRSQKIGLIRTIACNSPAVRTALVRMLTARDNILKLNPVKTMYSHCSTSIKPLKEQILNIKMTIWLR